MKILIEQSEKIIEKAVQKFKKSAILWAGGKDSTVQLLIIKKFLNSIPFPVLFIDTGYQFPETYQYIKRYANEWEINLITIENKEAKEKGTSPWTASKFKCCTELKTDALKEAIKKYNFDCIFVAIRWDECKARAEEQYFSSREDHTRVHPILHWSEKEIWKYLKKNKVPTNPLYDIIYSGELKYRSIGCYPCTKPVSSSAGEREGRTLDKEKIMEKLRALGYM